MGPGVYDFRQRKVDATIVVRDKGVRRIEDVFPMWKLSAGMTSFL